MFHQYSVIISHVSLIVALWTEPKNWKSKIQVDFYPNQRKKADMVFPSASLQPHLVPVRTSISGMHRKGGILETQAAPPTQWWREEERRVSALSAGTLTSIRGPRTLPGAWRPGPAIRTPPSRHMRDKTAFKLTEEKSSSLQDQDWYTSTLMAHGPSLWWSLPPGPPWAWCSPESQQGAPCCGSTVNAEPSAWQNISRWPTVSGSCRWGLVSCSSFPTEERQEKYSGRKEKERKRRGGEGSLKQTRARQLRSISCSMLFPSPRPFRCTNRAEGRTRSWI